MTPTMPSTHPCPDLEELAAFVDGRLEDDARAAVVEHLASCEDCYEVYAETLRVIEDLEAEPVAVDDEAANDDLAPVVRHPRSFPWAWPTAAAALAAAAVVLVLRLPDFLSTSRTSGELVAVAGIRGETDLGEWYAHGWSTTRGPNPYEYLSPEERSFRVGVRFVDLRSALALEDRDVAQNLAAELALLIEADGLGLQYFLSESLRGDFGPGAPMERLNEIAAQTEESFVPENETYFELGKQIETARLAALIGNARYFEGHFRRYLRRLERDKLDKELAQSLADFEVLARSGPNLESLEMMLSEIIDSRKPSL